MGTHLTEKLLSGFFNSIENEGPSLLLSIKIKQ